MSLLPAEFHSSRRYSGFGHAGRRRVRNHREGTREPRASEAMPRRAPEPGRPGAASSTFASSTSEYTTGTTISVRNVEVKRPPITTVASSEAMISPSERPSASGIRASIVAMAVIRIGLTRVRPPCIRASYIGIPRRRCCSTRSSRTMAFVTTMPISIRKPIRALMPIGRWVMKSAGKAPIVASGRLNMMTNGSIRESKTRTMTM